MTEVARDKLQVRVANLDCENEAAAIQRAMSGTSGIHEIEVRAASASVTISFDPALVTREALKRKLAEVGYPPVERTDTSKVTPRAWSRTRRSSSARPRRPGAA